MKSQRLILFVLLGSLLIVAAACMPIPGVVPVGVTGTAPTPLVEEIAAGTAPITTTPSITATAAITTPVEMPVAATPVVTSTLPMTETVAPPVALTTYRDEVGGFEIDYPAGWSLVDVAPEVKQDSLGYSITLMSWQPQDGGTEGIAEGGSKVDIGVTLGGGASVEQAAEARRGELTTGDAGNEIIFEEPWELAGGLEATHWIVQRAEDEPVEELITAIEGSRIVVSGLGDPALFEQIAASLRPVIMTAQAKQSDAPLAAATEAAPAGAAAPVVEEAAAAESLAGTTYTVRSGDTLAKIAGRFGVTVRALLAANPQIANADRIYIGQRLIIPTGGTQPAPLPPATQRVNITMIGLGDGSVGCGDSAVAVRRDIPKTPAPLTAALKLQLAQKSQYYGESGLYNALYQSNLGVAGISRSGSAWTIRLTGTLVLGGVCDGPRVKAQLEQTALQFSTVQSVRFFVNGQALESLISGQ